MMKIRKPKKKDKTQEQLRWLEGSVGILGNANEYGKARVEAAYNMAKTCYEFLCSREEFRDWYLVEHTLKEL